jgi:hypothetical protein
MIVGPLIGAQIDLCQILRIDGAGGKYLKQTQRASSLRVLPTQAHA